MLGDRALIGLLGRGLLRRGRLLSAHFWLLGPLLNAVLYAAQSRVVVPRSCRRWKSSDENFLILQYRIAFGGTATRVAIVKYTIYSAVFTWYLFNFGGADFYVFIAASLVS